LLLQIETVLVYKISFKVVWTITGWAIICCIDFKVVDIKS
jgi:hypothetical protein